MRPIFTRTRALFNFYHRGTRCNTSVKAAEQTGIITSRQLLLKPQALPHCEKKQINIASSHALKNHRHRLSVSPCQFTAAKYALALSKWGGVLTNPTMISVSLPQFQISAGLQVTTLIQKGLQENLISLKINHEHYLQLQECLEEPEVALTDPLATEYIVAQTSFQQDSDNTFSGMLRVNPDHIPNYFINSSSELQNQMIELTKLRKIRTILTNSISALWAKTGKTDLDIQEQKKIGTLKRETHATELAILELQHIIYRNPQVSAFRSSCVRNPILIRSFSKDDILKQNKENFNIEQHLPKDYRHKPEKSVNGVKLKLSSAI